MVNRDSTLRSFRLLRFAGLSDTFRSNLYRETPMAHHDQGNGTLVDVFDPTEDVVSREEAKRVAQRMKPLVEHPDLLASSHLYFRSPDGRTEDLPLGIAHMIVSILEEAARGAVVALVSESEEVGTGTAASFLGVSRPHVAKLIDSGLLPGRRERKHRRVRMVDLVAYKRSTERTHAILDDLTRASEAQGLYDPPKRRRG